MVLQRLRAYWNGASMHHAQLGSHRPLTRASPRRRPLRLHSERCHLEPRPPRFRPGLATTMDL